MKQTIRLFDENSHLYSFDATVLSCKPTADPRAFAVVLDATAFFPEGGGQGADRGTLEGLTVIDVQEANGIITHTVCADACPFAAGQTVRGELDRALRHERMQCHTGEHIVSGIIHRRFGFRNVGFHLGDDDVTLDFDGVLDRAALDEIEEEANRAVVACLPVRAWYPDPEDLAKLSYRAKLDLTENVRIVEIGEDGCIDRCACCAPHVANTGEIGLIKLLDFIHYKGGVRIHMHCGVRALADYRRRYTAVAAMAAAMSIKQDEVTVGFDRLLGELEEKKQTISALRGRLEVIMADAIVPTEGSLCLFDTDLEPIEMRRLLNRAVQKCGRFCGVFVGDDERGYRYAIGRGTPDLDLRAYTKEINAALSARGGGSSEMLQGSATATRAEIETFFAEL
jgi:alanyl-tRNA synthetase